MKSAILLLLFLLQGSTLSQTPTGAIAGQLRGVSGQPVANVRVSVMEVTEQDVAGGTPALVGFAQTDANGSFRIDRLPPGRYFILAGPLDSPTYYPGAAQRTAAMPISITAGAFLDTLNFSLSPENQNGMLQVVVEQAGKGTPIAGADVTVRRTGQGAALQNPINAMTDANGQVTFGGLAPGQYGVTVQSAGFVGTTSTRSGTRPTVSGDVTLSVEQNEARIVFALTTSATIEGRVQSANGQPITNLRISLLQMGYQGRRGLVTTGFTATTDTNGRYSLSVGPGQYYVRLETGARPTGQQIPPVAYYPGVTSIAEAKPLLVDSGDKRTADITLANLSGFTISGSFINPLPGGGSGGAILSLYLIPRSLDVVDLDSPLVPNIVPLNVRRDGGTVETPFEIRGVAPGDYDLYPLFGVNSNGTRSVYYTARTPIMVRDKDITNLSVKLRRNVELKGRFVLEGIVGPIAWDSVRVQLRSREFLPSLVQTQIGRIGQVDSNTRTLTAAELPETILDIVVSGLPNSVYVSDIRQGNKSVYATGVDTRSGTAEPVDIVLRSDPASITGTVRSSVSWPPSVLLRPAKLSQIPQLYKREGTTQNSGQFSITGIAPGDYVLYALPVLPVGGVQENDDYMKKYEGQGRPITLTASQTERVELTMIDDPSLIPVAASPEALPQISNRIVRTADMNIITADSASANGQRGARGARGRAVGNTTPAAAGARANAAADYTAIARNLALNPATPEERTQLLNFLQQNGQALIGPDKVTAERLFRKGQELDPNNSRWASQLGQLYALAAQSPNISNLQITSVEAARKSVEEYGKALVLGNTSVLSEMAESARRANMTDQAIEYAQRAIASGNADQVHGGNSTLGLIALGKGETANAKKYLLASGAVAGSPVLGSFGPGMNLANELLSKGERDTVMAYLEECLQFWKSGQDQLNDWISTLKAGGTPALLSSTGR